MTLLINMLTYCMYFVMYPQTRLDTDLFANAGEYGVCLPQKWISPPMEIS